MSDLISSEDLVVTVWPDRGKGGQHVGTETGVRVEHVPSGLVACANLRASQHRNKEIAIEMIIGGLTSRAYR